MRLLSVNTSLPRDLIWQDKPVRTSIFKQPVAGPVEVFAEHLAGDGQADLKHHGGPNKAVYAYPTEHYPYWAAHVPREKLVPGAFGENLTTEGLLESDVRLGDCFQIGSAVLMAVQPRVPCFKLGVRLDDARMVKRFQQAGRSGIYFRVVEPGTLQAGDLLTLVERAAHEVTVQQAADSYYGIEREPGTLRALLEMPYLPPSMKMRFRAALKPLQGEGLGEKQG
ncbi:MOSC domain-containing protein [uncultured Hymenobacter sp.]|uniref:MOSC domain-containing protein n=1 Tax=uncultured Hymenobacter sp. TaxID=170016 RepID=UPI0035C9A763